MNQHTPIETRPQPKVIRDRITLVIQTADRTVAEGAAWAHVGTNHYELISVRRVEELRGRGHGWEFTFQYTGMAFVGIE